MDYMNPKREGIPADKVAQDLSDEGVASTPQEAAWMLIDMGEYHELDFTMPLRMPDGTAITS